LHPETLHSETLHSENAPLDIAPNERPTVPMAPDQVQSVDANTCATQRKFLPEAA
jgi:hypothetical protein